MASFTISLSIESIKKSLEILSTIFWAFSKPVMFFFVKTLNNSPRTCELTCIVLKLSRISSQVALLFSMSSENKYTYRLVSIKILSVIKFFSHKFIIASEFELILFNKFKK